MPNRTKAKVKSLEKRRKQYDRLPTDEQKRRKRPGSRKK